MAKKEKPIDLKRWERYEEETDELYSYLKKKGKHKRAKTDTPNKSV